MTGTLRRSVALVAGAAAALALLTWACLRLVDRPAWPVDDFVAYWSAGRLQFTGGDPYSAAQLYPLQKAQGWPEEIAQMVWNPPFCLPVLVPFAIPPFRTGRGLWMAFHVALVAVSALWLWALYRGEPRRRILALLLAFGFVPTLVALRLGQIGPLMVLGAAAFLSGVQSGRWVIAGAGAALLALKPQLVYLFWVALPLWALVHRRWALLGGAAAILCLMTIISITQNPTIIGDYRAAVASHPPFEYATPTLGTALRLLFGRERHWLQFAPTALGLVWGLAYCLPRLRSWRWEEELPLLVLLSLFSTAYGWRYDQILLLPALLQAALCVMRDGRPAVVRAAVVGFLLFDLGSILTVPLAGTEFAFIWTMPVLLGGYLTLRAVTRPAPTAAAP